MSGAAPALPTHAELASFVVREARLLDEKRYEDWLALFAPGAHYWVPLAPEQDDPVNHASLAYEDLLLLRLRVERLKSPRAFSEQPPSRSHHLLQHPEVEHIDADAGHVIMRTPFLYSEARGDAVLSLAGTARHTLARLDGHLRILLKRVDLLQCDAALPSIQLFP